MDVVTFADGEDAVQGQVRAHSPQRPKSCEGFRAYVPHWLPRRRWREGRRATKLRATVIAEETSGATVMVVVVRVMVMVGKLGLDF